MYLTRPWPNWLRTMVKPPLPAWAHGRPCWCVWQSSSAGVCALTTQCCACIMRAVQRRVSALGGDALLHPTVATLLNPLQCVTSADAVAPRSLPLAGGGGSTRRPRVSTRWQKELAASWSACEGMLDQLPAEHEAWHEWLHVCVWSPPCALHRTRATACACSGIHHCAGLVCSEGSTSTCSTQKGNPATSRWCWPQPG